MSDALLDRDGIEALIPHREPFIFVDRIVELEYGQRAVGIMEDVGAHHEHVLRGHFPGFPVLPGAIIVEAVAEVGGVAALGMPENSGKIAMLTGLDKWKFRQPARPGRPVAARGRGDPLPARVRPSGRARQHRRCVVRLWRDQLCDCGSAGGAVAGRFLD